MKSLLVLTIVSIASLSQFVSADQDATPGITQRQSLGQKLKEDLSQFNPVEIYSGSVELCQNGQHGPDIPCSKNIFSATATGVIATVLAFPLAGLEVIFDVSSFAADKLKYHSPQGCSRQAGKLICEGQYFLLKDGTPVKVIWNGDSSRAISAMIPQLRTAEVYLSRDNQGEGSNGGKFVINQINQPNFSAPFPDSSFPKCPKSLGAKCVIQDACADRAWNWSEPSYNYTATEPEGLSSTYERSYDCKGANDNEKDIKLGLSHDLNYQMSKKFIPHYSATSLAQDNPSCMPGQICRQTRMIMQDLWKNRTEFEGKVNKHPSDQIEKESFRHLMNPDGYRHVGRDTNEIEKYAASIYGTSMDDVSPAVKCSHGYCIGDVVQSASGDLSMEPASRKSGKVAFVSESGALAVLYAGDPLLHTYSTDSQHLPSVKKESTNATADTPAATTSKLKPVKAATGANVSTDKSNEDAAK